MGKPSTCMQLFQRHSRVVAFFSMALAGLCFSVANSIVQLLHVKSNDDLPSSHIILIRSILQLVLAVIVLAARSIVPFNSWKDVIYLVVMGAADVGATYSLYVALELIPVGDATVILFTKPIFTYIFSYLLFRERCWWQDLLAGLFSFLGVVILSNPSLGISMEKARFATMHGLTTEHANIYGEGSERYLHGVSLALVSAILFSLYFGINKWSGKIIDVSIPVFYPGLLGTLLLTGSSLFGKDPLFFREFSTTTWVALFWISILTFFGYMLMAEAFQLEDATPIVLVQNLDAVFAFLLEIIVIGIIPSWTSILGSILILFSTGFISFRRFWMTNEASHKESTTE